MRLSSIHVVFWIALLPAVSLAAPNRELEDLVVAGLHWQDAEPAIMQGVALAYRGFRSDESPVQVAAALSAGYPQFRQVLSVAGHLLLSGMRDGAHWLAHVEPVADGARGTVSVLHMPDGSAADPESGMTPTGLPAWLPAQSRIVLDHSGDHSGTVRQQVFRVPGNTGDLTAYLRTELRSRGWSLIHPVNRYGVPGVWQRGPAVMHVSVHSAGIGNSLLYVQEQR